VPQLELRFPVIVDSEAVLMLMFMTINYFIARTQ